MGNGKITKERTTKSVPKRIRIPVTVWEEITNYRYYGRFLDAQTQAEWAMSTAMLMYGRFIEYKVKKIDDKVYLVSVW